MTKLDKQIGEIINSSEAYRDNWVGKEMKREMRGKLKSLIRKEVERCIGKLDVLDVIVPCEPDCTPEQHAYHQGAWDAQIKIDEWGKEAMGRMEK